MKILSMTATFGKLVNQTLQLEPGMNIIHAPNEWGKSTWCAFLEAMLYGIDTASRSKTGFLADKEHYAPWTGEPMSGRMDILWQGRAITIQRQSKGRVPMGEVRAYETDTGLPVPELSVSNCGEILLGVERSVFVRAGFLKQSQMPVTEDEKLRRRLNELVTTGDESGASDLLAQKLRDLKNRCRFNKKGLLPEAEAEKQELEQKLQQLQALQNQITGITQRQETLDQQIGLLENHKQALRYQEHLKYAQRLTVAQMDREAALQSMLQVQKDCEGLPPQQTIQQHLTQMQQLRDTRDSLHAKSQLLPPLPPMPEAPAAFRGRDPEQVVADAKLEAKVLQQLKHDRKTPVPYIAGGALAAVGACLLLLSRRTPILLAVGVFLLCGVICFILGARKHKKLKLQIAQLLEKYRNIPEDLWEREAQSFAAAQQSYFQSLAQRQQQLAELNRLLDENAQEIAVITGGTGLSQYEDICRSHLQSYHLLQEKQRVLQQAEVVLQALSEGEQVVQPPRFADTLQLSRQETEETLAEAAGEKQMLHQRLGQCQGQMESLGKEDFLQDKRLQLEARIEALKTHDRALTLAQHTLQQATRELQRRFAPRISQRAQTLFARLTEGRYQRLALNSDLSVESGAEGENTLHSSLWRSDGTADQLYLALRLAVAEALTPSAPLILDDALVRFDDDRLAAAMEVLQEQSRDQQVIIFTCQSREETYWNHRKETL